MPELGATEDPTVLIPGNPVFLRTAGASYRRYALTLEDASAGLARVATPQGWSGPAADGFRAAFAPEPRRWQDAAAAFGEAARAADDQATALEWARGRAGEAVARWREAQVASTTARAQYAEAIAAGAVPVPFVDPGDAARADAERLLADARQHVRDSGDRSAAVVTAACATAPAAPGFWGELAEGAGAVAAQAGNALASVGNALLRNPLDAAAVVGGGALAAVSAAGVVGTVALDATGVGAVAGVPLGGLALAGMATGVGIAGVGAADAIAHAAGDDRVAPFTVAADADGGADVPFAPADRIPTIGIPGHQDGVRELPDEQAITDLYEELAEEGTPASWDGYQGRVVELPDGTQIGLRSSSKFGETLDAKLPSGERWTLLSADDGAGKILLRGLIDWVSLDEARWLVSLAEPGTSAEVRDATLRGLTLLVEHDLVRLGELDPRFEPWPLNGQDALQRVRREWWDPEKEMHPGSICWLDNTPAGDEVARRIEAARDT